MYNQTQDPLNQPCHVGYRLHQQQRWPDQTQTRHEFPGLHHPPPMTQASIHNKRASQGQISSLDRRHSLENAHIPYRNAPSGYHANHLPHMHARHVQHLTEPRLSSMNCPLQHRVIQQQHQIHRQQSLGYQVGPRAKYSEPVETKVVVKSELFEENSDSCQTAERLESTDIVKDATDTPGHVASTSFSSEILSHRGRPLQPVDINTGPQQRELGNLDLKENKPREATPVSCRRSCSLTPLNQSKPPTLSPISMCFSQMLGAGK
jgi:hypothetical protein